jgi:hypothetical protein
MDAGFSLQDMARVLCFILRSQMEKAGPWPRVTPQASLCAQPHSSEAGAALFDIQRACWALGSVLQTVLASLFGAMADSHCGSSLAIQTVGRSRVRAHSERQQPGRLQADVSAGSVYQCTCQYCSATGCAGKHGKLGQSSWRSWSLCLCSGTACPHHCTSTVQDGPPAQAWPWLLCAYEDLAWAKRALQDVGLCCESCAAWWSIGWTGTDV